MFPSRRRSIAALVLCLLLPAVLLAGAYAAQRRTRHALLCGAKTVSLSLQRGRELYGGRTLTDSADIQAFGALLEAADVLPAAIHAYPPQPHWYAELQSDEAATLTARLYELPDEPGMPLGLCLTFPAHAGDSPRSAFFRIPDPAQQLELLLHFVSVPAVERAECSADSPDGRREAVCGEEQAQVLLGAIHLLTDTLRGMPDYGWDKSRVQRRYAARFSGPDGQETAYELLLTEPGEQAALLRRDGEETHLYLFSGAAVQARLEFAFEQALDAGAAP